MSALPIGAVTDYVRHVRDSVPMRAIARQRGLPPSTIMRRIHRVEDMREPGTQLDRRLCVVGA